MSETPETDTPKTKSPKRADGAGGAKAGAPNNNFMGRGGMIWLLLGLFLIGALVMMNSSNRATEVDRDTFFQHVKDKDFDFANNPLVVKDDRIVGQLKPEPGAEEGAEGAKLFMAITLETKRLRVIELENMGANTKEKPSSNMLWIAVMQFGPILLIVFLIYFFFIRSIRSAGGGPGGMLGNFGRSRHKVLSKEHSTVKLDDVAGINEAKEEVQEIIQFLKNPKKFQRLGGRVPRGVLLVGQPGCGKTLLAKAVAGEADVPFFSLSGSDFVEMFVGVGASRVRDLFKQAKESSPCIIFLDEIDAVGRKRGQSGMSGGHDEREQTLNAILVEMDGFGSSDQVIVMAATNRNDVLDPALTRPGRFDRSISVSLPDVIGRMEILRVHGKKVKLADTVDFEALARATPMFSGAELAALINEAAIGATLNNKDFVEQDDLEEARDKVRFGRANKSRKFEEEERVATAYHEAGHAILQYLLEHADPLHKVTIMPRGPFLGASFQLPKKDRLGYGRKFVEAQMRVACGGRIAEEKKTTDVTSGASQDIRQVSQYARMMVLQWGMSEKLGFIDFITPEYQETMAPERPYSEETAKIIDDEVKRLTQEAYVDAERILNERWDDVVRIAEALLQHETLTSDDVDNLMNGKPVGRPTVAELLEAERQKEEEAAVEEPKPVSEPVSDGDEDQAPGGLMPSPA